MVCKASSLLKEKTKAFSFDVEKLKKLSTSLSFWEEEGRIGNKIHALSCRFHVD
jgi:hypothetical protein